MIEVIEKIGNIENLSLKNDEMEVVVSTFGCTIIKMIVEDKNGVKGDVVLGYDDFNQYQTLDGYLGALVGRVANRIGKGTFELNGETYHLPINNGPNSREFDSCLHFFTNQIAQNVDYINAFEFFYCQICEIICRNM